VGRALAVPPMLTPLPADRFPLVLAPTGMVPTRAQTPYVPLTPREIAADVARCAELGISSVHVHARDADGRPDWRRDTYARIVDAVRTAAPDVLVNVSTSGRTWSDLERRADSLALDGDLKPHLASLTLSSLNFLSGPSVNAPDLVRGLATIMLERGIIPELEVFDLGMANMIGVLQRQGLLPGPVVVNLFLGNIAGAQARPLDLGAMLAALPAGALWSGAGIGTFRSRAHALALASGGGARVGLEDGIHLDAGRTVLARNDQLVTAVLDQARLLGRTPASPGQLRAALGVT
jgi:3-oxoadipate:acetyl-CoA acetyltransferase